MTSEEVKAEVKVEASASNTAWFRGTLMIGMQKEEAPVDFQMKVTHDGKPQ
eukprot:gene10288-28011_t